ncbi:MAG: tRNA (guanosine(37)-N1)-methyltransferase TrmD [Gemmatimonadetes bacterium]|nr:tRNA (guanosine(37)-N1)-methyltransferase TrmD [Gemmatimonadota bacterium]MYB57560.1 tRNA (guanosine(37)-N1)-methyltransferase TrmD [Gemmatimonadota bacterium]
MRIDVITIFPDLIRDVLKYSIPRRAIDAGLIDILAHDLRDHADDKHKTIDDTPYGGGAGMIFKPEPIARAIEALPTGGRMIFLTPQGRQFTQSVANELSLSDHLVLLCGHYRGIDERVRESYVDDEISIGDYVLSGGELPALILIDALIRLIPGAIGNAESALEDSFQNGLLDCAWYTRPREFEGLTVPEALLSGDHKKVAQWRRDNARQRTLERRPDLLE